MACYQPIKGYRTDAGIVFSSKAGAAGDLITVPCRQCLGCRISRRHEWAVRAMHEAQMTDQDLVEGAEPRGNCFITLTYRDADLPKNFSVDIKDWQAFAKRSRKVLGKFRFFMVGEYGTNDHRPHMHACLFGQDFSEDRKYYTTRNGNKFYRSEKLESLWRKGFSDVTDMTYQTAAYVAGYCVKKRNGDQAVHWHGPRTPEFLNMSRRPGIGARWIERFHSDVFPCDFVVVDGRKSPVPRYYDEWLEENDSGMLDQLKADRAFAGAERIGDKTEERLRVRKACAEAKVRERKEF